MHLLPGTNCPTILTIQIQLRILHARIMIFLFLVRIITVLLCNSATNIACLLAIEWCKMIVTNKAALKASCLIMLQKFLFCLLLYVFSLL